MDSFISGVKRSWPMPFPAAHPALCRGFPAIANRAGLYNHQPFRQEEVIEFREALPELFWTTTIRGLRLGLDDTPHLQHILTTPVARQISILDLSDYRRHHESPAPLISDLCQS